MTFRYGLSKQYHSTKGTKAPNTQPVPPIGSSQRDRAWTFHTGCTFARRIDLPTRQHQRQFSTSITSTHVKTYVHTPNPCYYSDSIKRCHQILAAAILDHHHLWSQNKIQFFHCIPHIRKTLDKTTIVFFYIDYIKSHVQCSMSSNCSDGHLGSMQIRKVPQSCHSGKRCIWMLAALSNTNTSKNLTVPTISGFTTGHPQLATRLHGDAN